MTENVSKSGDIDSYGFRRSAGFDKEQYDNFMASYLRVLTRRAMRWDSVMGNKDTVTRSAKVKRFCRKGVPSSLRPVIWMVVSGAETRMKTNPHLYTQMLEQPHAEELVETINMDLHRTFPDNVYFTTVGDKQCLRQPLFNVLVALGHKNKESAYCQGMNFVAGLLLLVLKKEDKVFWLMDTLMNNLLPDYYNPSMEAVKIDQEVLGELVKWKAPQVYSHVEKLGLSWCLVGMKWFICLFADVLPVETVFRIWDCLFYEGSKILLRASLVLILLNRDKILQTQNFGALTDLFKTMISSPQVVECHSFLQAMFKNVGSLPMSRIDRLREECKSRM